MSTSVHEQIGRYRKARKIVAALVQAKLDDPTLLDDAMWDAAVKAACGPNAIGSQATRALVVELLRERSAA